MKITTIQNTSKCNEFQMIQETLTCVKQLKGIKGILNPKMSNFQK